MINDSNWPTVDAVLLRKFTRHVDLSEQEAEAARQLPFRMCRFPQGHDVVREGDRPSDCCLLVSGYLCRHRTTSKGGRQIISIHVPGDLPDLQSLHLPIMDHSLASLSPCEVALIPHHAIRALIRTFPALTEALWRDSQIEAAGFREWVVHTGRSGRQRIAHLMCEMYIKMRAIDAADRLSCPFPLTQRELGEATGLSTMHVSRILRALRRDGLVSLGSGRLTILDWDSLSRLADFDETYLYRGPAAPAWRQG